LEHTAHTLKGALGALGAKRAFDAALRLEMMGRRGDLSRAGEASAELQEEIERLQPALAALATGEVR
jgi:HPt (histidine-containing phosphotransfer) domain-containing protein